MSTWFRYRKIDDRLIHIDDNAYDSIFLFEGDEKALLIDTGFGLGDLRGLLERLTDKPIEVFNTHGHIDHMSGNYQFPQAYMHAADIPLCSGPLEQAVVDFIRDRILRNGFPAGFDRRPWQTRKVPPQTLMAGAYDFGEVSLTSIHTPGHTPGSVAYRIDPPGYVFVGDTLVHGPSWLHLEESEPLPAFLYSARALERFCRGARGVYCSHSPEPLPPHIIEDFPGFLERVSRGEVPNRHMQTFAGDGLVYYSEEPYGILLPTQIGV